MNKTGTCSGLSTPSDFTSIRYRRQTSEVISTTADPNDLGRVVYSSLSVASYEADETSSETSNGQLPSRSKSHAFSQDVTLADAIRADVSRNRTNPKGAIVVVLFRLAQRVAHQKETNLTGWIAGIPYLLAYRVIVEWFMGIEIPAKTDIGPGLIVQHGQGAAVNCHATIGANAMIRSGVVIGNKLLADGTDSGCPTLGDNVEIGANAVIIGPITIGDGARIGAGAVVTKDVPPGATARASSAAIIHPA